MTGAELTSYVVHTIIILGPLMPSLCDNTIIFVAGYADQGMCMRVSGTPTSAMVEALCTGMTGENATLASG